ncbi:MAG: hypothetical protein JWM47_3546 [Acidimicrobiales bacterium]|nr:hypothetical protein [Acidimicrobiales bacterium]
MLLLHNPVQRYAWGATDGLAGLVGSDPSGGPEAELWVGTHPAAPSVVAGDPAGRTLAEVIAADPVRWLGPDLAAAGHTALPFLLKVLAIGRPLSLQAHPSPEQARDGFEREEAAGIARDAPERTYKDPNPKPESLVALSESWALCGFRPPSEAAESIAGLDLTELAGLPEILGSGSDAALGDGLAWLLRQPPEAGRAVAAAVAEEVADTDPADRGDPRSWVRTLAAAFPGDPLCVAPLLLHVVRLGPGDAVHLPAGNLHAYLDGAGVELMAASDNVLRGGLTAKHVDVDELLHVLRFEPGVPAAPTRTDLGGGRVTYDSGEEAYALTAVDPSGGPVAIEPGRPSLLLATGGPVDIAGPHGGVAIDHGDAAFVAPGEGPLTVTGHGRLWWATVGDGLPR